MKTSGKKQASSLRIILLRLICLCSLSVANIPATSATTYMEYADSADRYLAKEKWADAERVLISALRLEPGNKCNSMLLSNLGLAQAHQGKIAEAMQSFDVGLAITPNSSAILENRASVYLLDGRKEDAYSDLTKAIEISPNTARIRKLHGFIALEKGDTATARKDFSTLIRLNDKDCDAYAGLSECARLSGNADLAIEYCSKAIEIEPDADTFFSRANLYISKELFTEAADDIRSGLRLNPRDGNLYLLRAYLHKLLFQNEDAEIDKKLAKEYGADTQLFQMLFPGK